MKTEILIQQIFDAFKNVKLASGIGLFEADCLDSYIDSAADEYKYWKSKDEREDWTNLLPIFFGEIEVERFNECSWTFMDAIGKRFVLPCYLIEELKFNQLDNPIYFQIKGGYQIEHLDILDQKQRNILLSFLKNRAKHYFTINDDFNYDECLECLEIINKRYTLNLPNENDN